MAGRDVRELLSIDLDALDGAAMDSLVLEVESLFRRLAGFRQDLVARIDASGVGLERGYKSSAAYLRDVLRISPGEASGLVHAARAASPRRALTGEPLEPIFPLVSAAQHAGEISPEHARIIVRTVESLPAEVQADFDRHVERTLVADAKQFDPSALRRVAKHVTDILNPDGRYSDPDLRRRQRGLDIRMNPDGSSHIEGDLTAECTELLLTVRDALGKPVTTDATPDPRTHRQRCHDAVFSGLDRLVRSGFLPDIAGAKATIVLRMSAQSYATGEGHAITGHGYRIPANIAKEWAGADHDVIGVVFNTARRIEAYGDKHRTFSANQRLALWARDRGCTFPGCDTPPAWTEAHHIQEFQTGGPTSTDNAALLCRYHHTHFAQLGWRCVADDDGPAWVPPRWLDPEQTPRRNHLR